MICYNFFLICTSKDQNLVDNWTIFKENLKKLNPVALDGSLFSQLWGGGGCQAKVLQLIPIYRGGKGDKVIQYYNRGITVDISQRTNDRKTNYLCL